MTELLEKAFTKIALELDVKEQDMLAHFLLEYNLHNFITENIRFISEYNAETQQAIQDAEQRHAIQYHNSVDDLFNKLGA
jgi:antitoxin component of RelBE/YafQ-DinJ toxin-antitoxin module